MASATVPMAPRLDGQTPDAELPPRFLYPGIFGQ